MSQNCGIGTSSLPSVRIAALNVFPIKSCAGTALDVAVLDECGIVGDRNWMVLKANGAFLSQRSAPEMATISPSFDGEALLVDGPGMSQLAVAPAPSPTKFETLVWKSPIEVADAGDDAARWFSECLKRPVRLVRAVGPRFVPPEYRRDGATSQVGLADTYPLHLSSIPTVRGLGHHVPPDRFRANVVIDGDLQAGDEDYWRVIRLGSLRAHVVKACKRCTISDVDQRTGVDTGDVVPLLKAARFGRRADTSGTTGSGNPGTFLGQHLLHEGPFPGSLRVGDEVTVEESSPEPNVVLG